MPWPCTACDVTLPDDVGACPTCGATKESWTVVQDRTRTLTVTRKKLEALVGASDAPAPPPVEPRVAFEVEAAEHAPALQATSALNLARQGLGPAPAHLLVARAHAGGDAEVEVTLTVERTADVAREHVVRREVPPALRGKGPVDVPFLLVYGPGAEQVAFPGVEVVDATDEAAEGGHAPAVELSGLRKRFELPVRAAQAPLPAAWVLGGGLFAFDSAFPGPAVAAVCVAVNEAAVQRPDARFAVFGHADKQGSDAYNKKLSDRRARAVLAMLVGDLAGLQRVAKDDGWGVLEQKAMLRAVGCDPGPIVEAVGPNTARAVRAFQRGWNEGLFHGRPGVPPRASGDLVVDGLLGPKTFAALLEAYLAELSCYVDAGRFVGPEGARFAGCGEFNPIGSAEENRRVVVAVFDGEAPPASEFPCREGKASACPVEAGQGQRCPFYRRWVPETRGETLAVAPFWDCAWLRDVKEPRKVYLSAVSTAPDGAEATFEVFRAPAAPRSPGADSADDGAPPDHGAPLASVKGVVRRGVAHATWTSDDADDPFDPQTWFPPVCLDDAALEQVERLDPGASLPPDHPWLRPAPARVPVFRVRVGEAWADSAPPGYRLDRVRVEDAREGETGTARLTDGRFVRVVVRDGWLAPAPDEKVDRREVHVIDLRLDAGDAREWGPYA